MEHTANASTGAIITGGMNDTKALSDRGVSFMSSSKLAAVVADASGGWNDSSITCAKRSTDRLRATLMIPVYIEAFTGMIDCKIASNMVDPTVTFSTESLSIRRQRTSLRCVLIARDNATAIRAIRLSPNIPLFKDSVGSHHATCKYVTMSAAPHTAANMVKTELAIPGATELVPSAGKMMSKVLCIKIAGSMDALAMRGPNSAIWQAVDGRHQQVFGGIETSGELIDGNKKLCIHEAEVLQYKNTFPTHIGTNISGLPRNEVTDTGECYTMTFLPNSSGQTPYMLYQAGALQNEATAWR